MKILPLTLESRTRCCLDRLKEAIRNGDTRLVRCCAMTLREVGVALANPRLTSLAHKLERSVTVCSLGESLTCLDELTLVVAQLAGNFNGAVELEATIPLQSGES